MKFGLRGLFIGPICALALAACDSELDPDAAAAAVVSGAEAEDPIQTCQIDFAGAALPGEVRETSGLVQSRIDANIFWTHNDSGENPEIFALDGQGQIAGRVDISGANFEDWEDIEAAPCATGNCLFIADTGDNDGERELVTIYRLPEPNSTTTTPAVATALNARYPDGARDAESLFVLPNGDIYLITKGRYAAISLFRYPAPQTPGETATLEHVRDLAPMPTSDADRVTAAAVSPGGGWIAVRTSNELRLYPTADFVTSATADPLTVDLSALGEAQGESVAFATDGSIWLTSEAGSDDQPPTWSRLTCTIPPSPN